MWPAFLQFAQKMLSCVRETLEIVISWDSHSTVKLSKFYSHPHNNAISREECTQIWAKMLKQLRFLLYIGDDKFVCLTLKQLKNCLAFLSNLLNKNSCHLSVIILLLISNSCMPFKICVRKTTLVKIWMAFKRLFLTLMYSQVPGSYEYFQAFCTTL